MPRGTQLSEFEKGQIKAFSEGGYSQTQIAKEIGRSRHVVQNFIKLGDEYGSKNHRFGRPRALSNREEREVWNMLATGDKSLREVQREASKKVSYGTIWNTAHKSEHLVYEKKAVKPFLTDEHKEKRLDFAKRYQTWDKEWNKVVFSDEKKFNLDGPDSYAFYWHDLRKEKDVFTKRQMGGGSVMVWGGVGYNGKAELQLVKPRSTASDYQAILQSGLLRQGPKIGGRGWLFQQDNASIHTSSSTKAFLDSKKVRVLDWPAKSPDLNIMENVWGRLSRTVYAHGRQFSNKDQLKAAIFQAWDSLPLDYIRGLYHSMKNRIFNVIMNRGGSSGY